MWITMVYTQKNCDKLLTPIVIKQSPKCLFYGVNKECTGNTQVAHHHCHKSKSLILRYDFENLINLCHHCHLMLHFNESYWASKVVQIKGLEWFAYIEKTKNKLMVGKDKINYEVVYKRLEKKLADLSTVG